MVRALQLSEGWPEGTSYWIHNRAFPFALASDCYLTAVGQERVEGLDIRGTIARTALWQLYSLQPDLSFARGGDCWEDGLVAGPGLWQRMVDHYAAPRRSGRHRAAVLSTEPEAPVPCRYGGVRLVTPAPADADRHNDGA
jgi:hypothetical protein